MKKNSAPPQAKTYAINNEKKPRIWRKHFNNMQVRKRQ